MEHVMYCPACGGPVLLFDTNTVRRFVACGSCPLVSEVVFDLGRQQQVLVDLGDLPLSELEIPFVVPERPPWLVQAPAATLHGRRDS